MNTFGVGYGASPVKTGDGKPPTKGMLYCYADGYRSRTVPPQ